MSVKVAFDQMRTIKWIFKDILDHQRGVRGRSAPMDVWPTTVPPSPPFSSQQLTCIKVYRRTIDVPFKKFQVVL